MTRSSVLLVLALVGLSPSVARAEARGEQTSRACRDGIDNDGDGHVDCADFDCRPFRFCSPLRPENTLAACSDGIDNDQDGRTDCADDECMALVFCRRGTAPPPEPLPAPGDREDTFAECQDRRDNDGDGRIDCRDPDCADLLACPEAQAGRTAGAERTVELCQDRSDNDADGLVDCDDPDCQVFVVCAPAGAELAPATEDTAALCDDGIDNDRDGDLDCADLDCASLPICTLPPTAEEGDWLCADGADNDRDGLVDCEDPGCVAAAACDSARQPPPAAPSSPVPAPSAAPAAGPSARLRVTSSPGATVLVDGQPVGTAPFDGPIALGEHVVRVEAEGYRPAERRIRPETPGAEVALSVRLVPTGRLDFGFFSLGLGLQPSFLMLGEAQSSAVGGASLQLRALFAAVRGPVILDLGLQLTTGYMGGSEFPAITRAGRDYETADGPAFFDAKYFTAGLFVGLTVPVLVRQRPVLALTFHTTQGFSAAPFQYVADLALGLSYFASDLVELRFELLGVQLWRVEAYTREPGSTGGYVLRDLWLAHLSPSLGVHLRF